MPTPFIILHFAKQTDFETKITEYQNIYYYDNLTSTHFQIGTKLFPQIPIFVQILATKLQNLWKKIYGKSSFLMKYPNIPFFYKTPHFLKVFSD